MLGASAYLVGTLEIALIAAGSVLGGARLRERLLPGFDGVAAWTAVAVLAFGILLVVAEVLGTLGFFQEIPYVVAVVVAGAVLWIRLPADGDDTGGAAPSDPTLPVPTGLRIAGIALVAVAVAHFTIGVRLRLSTGMTGFDSTWYHGPFAAGFAQDGHTFALHLIAPQFLAWFYPQNSELLHGVGDLLYGRDILSPLLNAGFFLGCVGAAWAIGRPYGTGPVSAAGVALVLDTGVLADQAGEARNDLAAAFFLLAAVAILVNAVGGRRDRRPHSGALAVSALAIGMAAGTKVNLLPVAGVMVIALVWLAGPTARRRAALITVPAALIGGGYWYLRNLVHAGNPVPQVRSLGPIDLPAPAQTLGGREGHSVLGYLTDTSVWSDSFGPGFHGALGLLWPALLVLGLAGLAGLLGPRSGRTLRAAGIVGVAAVLTWLAAPTSASGPDGSPLGFESGLRYLAPALLLGAALAPVSPVPADPRRRAALLTGIAFAFPFADRSAGEWSSGYLAVAVLAGIAFAAAVWFTTWPGRPRIPRTGALAAGAAVILIAVAGGYKVQRTYLENRYSDPQFTVEGLDAAFRWAQPLSGERIGTTTTRTYPLLGRDLSNTVEFVGVKRPHGGFVAPEDCRAWIEALSEGDYDYVVASKDRLGGNAQFPPQAAWTATQPGVTEVLRRPPTVVFGLSEPLDPALCGPTTPS